ncbi:MAG: hypothetical protein AB7V32_09815 [Candidatus Berkiella sp.]
MTQYRKSPVITSSQDPRINLDGYPFAKVSSNKLKLMNWDSWKALKHVLSINPLVDKTAHDKFISDLLITKMIDAKLLDFLQKEALDKFIQEEQKRRLELELHDKKNETMQDPTSGIIAHPRGPSLEEELEDLDEQISNLDAATNRALSECCNQLKTHQQRIEQIQRKKEENYSDVANKLEEKKVFALPDDMPQEEKEKTINEIVRDVTQNRDEYVAQIDEYNANVTELANIEAEIETVAQEITATEAAVHVLDDEIKVLEQSILSDHADEPEDVTEARFQKEFFENLEDASEEELDAMLANLEDDEDVVQDMDDVLTREEKGATEDQLKALIKQKEEERAQKSQERAKEKTKDKTSIKEDVQKAHDDEIKRIAEKREKIKQKTEELVQKRNELKQKIDKNKSSAADSMFKGKVLKFGYKLLCLNYKQYKSEKMKRRLKELKEKDNDLKKRQKVITAACNAFLKVADKFSKMAKYLKKDSTQRKEEREQKKQLKDKEKQAQIDRHNDVVTDLSAIRALLEDDDVKHAAKNHKELDSAEQSERKAAANCINTAESILSQSQSQRQQLSDVRQRKGGQPAVANDANLALLDEMKSHTSPASPATIQVKRSQGG